MLKDLAGISQLSQLTHLELNQEGDNDDGLEDFLQSKVNLQYLSLQGHNLISSPNLFTINSTYKLNSNTVIFNKLTNLDISKCNVTNQMLFDIILSPKLPNLTTLIATNINQGDQINPYIHSYNTTNISIGGYRNSSNLTELNMNCSFVHPVAEMIKFTPKLKKLLIWDLRRYDYEIEEDYSFLVHADSKLSQLEYLEIAKTTGLIESVFTNSMFSNLKYLKCRSIKIIGEDELNRAVKMIEECVNLTKLERVSEYIVKGDSKAQKQEVKIAFRNNPIFNLNQLKIQDFIYESVYPNCNLWKRNDFDRISIR